MGPFYYKQWLDDKLESGTVAVSEKVAMPAVPEVNAATNPR